MYEWGYKIEDEDATPIDTPSQVVQDESLPEDPSFEPIEWVYSYWLWQTSRTYLSSTDTLEQWQGLLVQALAQGGHKVQLSVGQSGAKIPNPFTVGWFDEHWVVFLNEREQPSAELAERAAAALIDIMGEPTENTRT